MRIAKTLVFIIFEQRKSIPIDILIISLENE